MKNAEQDQINSFLTFRLGQEEYAAHVSQVLNILEMTDITTVPKSPEYMKGVINLRGMVLPVVDTRVKFGMQETEYTDKTCIVVMDLEMDGGIVHVGALVDEVVAVIEIDENEIKPRPSIGESYKSEFIIGLAKIDDHFIMILDPIKIFSTSEINVLKENMEIKEALEEKEDVEIK
jgi:purine-binding chemotaxis protein CheW